MADDNPDSNFSATYPAPPPFWKHFTPDNLARFKELQDAAKAGSSSEQNNGSNGTSAPPIPDLPPELRYLQPPAPPANGRYRVFGDQYDINAPLLSLRAMDVEQLYPSPPSSPTPQQQSTTTTTTTTTSSSSPSPSSNRWTLDRATYIKRMTQSLLLNYLELLGVLAVRPHAWQDKYEHMQTLLFNAHHLINEYRPHQARASLIAMMEDAVRRCRDEVDGVRRMRGRIEDVLGALAREEVGAVEKEKEEAEGEEEEEEEEEEAKERRRRSEQRAVMRALDEELLAE